MTYEVSYSCQKKESLFRVLAKEWPGITAALNISVPAQPSRNKPRTTNVENKMCVSINVKYFHRQIYPYVPAVSFLFVAGIIGSEVLTSPWR